MSLITSTPHIFSGICVCGHHAHSHHGNMIFRPDIVGLMQSGTWYAECEANGVNENWEHCPTCPVGFVDKDDPLKDQKLGETI
jgi:hypothetical protein